MNNRRALPNPSRQAAAPSHGGSWLIAASAFGAMAIAALQGGTRIPSADARQAANVQTATFTDSTGTVPAPGLPGTQSGPAVTTPWAAPPTQPFPGVPVPQVSDPPAPNTFQAVFPAVGVSANVYPKLFGLGFGFSAAADTQWKPDNGISLAFTFGAGSGGVDAKVSLYNTPVSLSNQVGVTGQLALPSVTSALPDALIPPPLGPMLPIPDFTPPTGPAPEPPQNMVQFHHRE